VITPIPGRATPDGTARFQYAIQAAYPTAAEALSQTYRQTPDDLTLSSLGLGTYLGKPDDSTDTQYRAALTRAVSMGCNVVDTSVNYRFQRSERAIGSWLKQALAAGQLERDELLICTKGGFVPYDTEAPVDARKWTYNTFIATEIAHANDFASNYQHCIAPGYLETMIAWSLTNLGVETIDVYYLHNPETQAISFSRETFRRRMTEAFETLELAVEHGQIANYGAATWTAFRSLTDSPDYLSLTELVALATEVAGQNHHFKYVQLPYNLFMTEAFAFNNQQLGEEFYPLLELAPQLGLTVMTSAGLHQGRLTVPIMSELMSYLPGLETDAQRALQFARSTPGVATALVGMSQIEHVRDNLTLMTIPPAEESTIRRMFKQDE